MKPFFSIIIPTLNEEKFLPKLLDCLINQDFSNFETIVVDAESRDKTLEILKHYQKKFIKNKLSLNIVISAKKNTAFQRNLGAKNAVGEYFVFFDADVQLPKSYLLKIQEKLKKNKLRLLATTWVSPDEDGFLERNIARLANTIMEVGKLIGKPVSYGFNTIVKRETFFKIGGFDPRVNVTDDYDFSLRAYKKGYHLNIFRSPRIYFSLRRFRARGWDNTLFEYGKILIYNFLKGAPKKKIFSYPMGGHEHRIKNPWPPWLSPGKPSGRQEL